VRRALLLALLGALAVPAAASAHASLDREWPAFRERMAFSPRLIVLRFDQHVDVLPGAIQVLDAKGRNLAGVAHAIERGLTVRVPVLRRGAYTVRWKALSTDGHVVNGVYTFGVQVPAPPVTDAVGAQGPTRVEHVVRWLYFVGIALLVGGLGFDLLVARVRWWLVTAGAIVTLEAGIVAFLLRAEDALQLPFTAFLYGDLSPIAGGTRFGQAFIAMELGFAFVAALLFLAWLTGRRAFAWGAFVLALAMSSGLSLSGHSSESALESFADWLHLSAGALWVGGLVHLAVFRRGLRRFSTLATVCVAVLVLAGVFLSVMRLPDLSDLWASSYGQVLLVKLALVSVALALGAYHRFVAVRTATVVAESALAMAVLLVAAVLVDSKPPAPVPSPDNAVSLPR
jgi:copper transport protein